MREGRRLGFRALARLWVGRVHLWLGLTLGIHLAVLGLTGSFIVFKDEIEFATLASKKREPGAPKLTPTQIVDAARAATGKEPSRLEYRKEPYSRVGVRIKGGEVWVDPITGAVDEAEHKGMEWALDLHKDLLFEKTGRAVSAWFGIGGVLLVLGGLYLWWPKTVGQLKNRLKVKRGTPWRRRALDLHNMAGALSLLPLLLIMSAGTALAWGKPVREFLLSQAGEPELAAAKVAQLSARVSLDEMIRTTERVAPGATEFVFLPQKPGDTLRVLKTLPNGDNWRTRIRVAVDPATGEVVRRDDPRRTFLGRLNDSLEAIHYGLFGGLATRWLSVVLGFIPVLMLVTGFSTRLYKWRAGRAKLKRHEDLRGHGRRIGGPKGRRVGDPGRGDDEPDAHRQERPGV